MKYLTLLLLALMVLSTSCKDDDDSDGFDPNANTIRIDGDNFSSPDNPAGTYEFAVRLDAEDLAPALGSNITGVRYFAYEAPINCVLRIYDENSDSEPGTMMYTANITNEFQPNSWNDHVLSTPIPVPQKDVWLSITFTQTETQMTVGCDSGPNVSGGDVIFTNNTWTTFSAITNGQESVNWNIRAIVD